MIANMRDLAGIQNRDGLVIKPNLFIRSASLRDITDEEMFDLYHNRHVTRVIDLRKNEEIHQYPDPILDHIAYISFPLQKTYAGDKLDYDRIFKEIAESDSDDVKVSLLPDMMLMYQSMLTTDFSRSNLRALISTLIGYNLGATLYHCTSGKDRTGMVTATLLMVLGVDREVIMRDYMASLPAAEIEAAHKAEKVLQRGARQDFADKIYNMYLVKEGYLNAYFAELDKQYESEDAFIHQFLRLDDSLIDWFKKRVLE